MSLRSGKLPSLGSEDEFFDHKRKATRIPASNGRRNRSARLSRDSRCQATTERGAAAPMGWVSAAKAQTIPVAKEFHGAKGLVASHRESRISATTSMSGRPTRAPRRKTASSATREMGSKLSQRPRPERMANKYVSARTPKAAAVDASLSGTIPGPVTERWRRYKESKVAASSRYAARCLAAPRPTDLSTSFHGARD